MFETNGTIDHQGLQSCGVRMAIRRRLVSMDITNVTLEQPPLQPNDPTRPVPGVRIEMPLGRAERLLTVLSQLNERELLLQLSYEHKALFDELCWGLDECLRSAATERL